MKVVYTNIFAIDEINGKAILEKIERCARKCYQSLPKGDPEGFVKHIIERGHTSVLEHVQLTFDITTDRGVLAEITRHRHASFSVESTRYCKYDKEMTFVDPIDMFDVPDDEALQAIWKRGCEQTERDYRDMMQIKPAAQVARSVTNQSLKTNLTMSINLRSMRNLFTLRCASGAHPHFKELSIPWLLWMKREIPVVFDDIEYDHEFYEKYKERLDRVVIDSATVAGDNGIMQKQTFVINEDTPIDIAKVFICARRDTNDTVEFNVPELLVKTTESTQGCYWVKNPRPVPIRCMRDDGVEVLMYCIKPYDSLCVIDPETHVGIGKTITNVCGALQLMLIPADTTGILRITGDISYALCEMVVKRKDVEK